MINIDKEVDRILTLLRNKIRERDFTQLDVQGQLQWGRSYISQLLTKQKSLRVEQVLSILNVINIEPKEFFAELYRWAPGTEAEREKTSVSFNPQKEAELSERLEQVQTTMERLVQALVDKDLLSPADLDGSAPTAPKKKARAKSTRRA